MNNDKNQVTINQIKDDLEKYYVLGHAEYDPDLYDQILHPAWKMFHLENGDLIEVDREEFCRWYEPQNKDPELVWNFEIHSVEVTGDVTQVKLSLEN